MMLGNPVKAAQARYFLDQVRLDTDVKPVCWCSNAPAAMDRLDVIADRAQQGVHLGVRHIDTEQPRQTLTPQHYRLSRAYCSKLLNMHGARLTASELEDQRSRTHERDCRQQWIDTALEALRRIGEQSQST